LNIIFKEQFKRLFDGNTFRPNQKQIIKNLLAGGLGGLVSLAVVYPFNYL